MSSLLLRYEIEKRDWERSSTLWTDSGPLLFACQTLGECKQSSHGRNDKIYPELISNQVHTCPLGPISCGWLLKIKHKTLPEAQRTQGIDSISWVNLSARIVQDWFQLHYLNWLQIWWPDGTTLISSKFGHQIAPLALVQNLVIRWSHLN